MAPRRCEFTDQLPGHVHERQEGIALLGGSGTYAFQRGRDLSHRRFCSKHRVRTLAYVPSGFTNNLVDGLLTLSGNSVVQLVDNEHTTSGSSPEALYADSLLVSTGSTFNLNGLHAYVRVAEINGTISGGPLGQIPSNGGSLAINSPVAANLGTAGRLRGRFRKGWATRHGCCKPGHQRRGYFRPQPDPWLCQHPDP